jgi:hypothetical protein
VFRDPVMRRFLLPLFVVAAGATALVPAASAAVPADAARVVELGGDAEPVNPSCPADPCEAMVRVTGYQGRSGSERNPFVIRRAGTILAFTVTLSEPTPEQIQFFNDNFGTPPRVQLAILRRGDTRKTRLNHRIVQQSDVYRVDRYLGSSPTFILDEPMRVVRGNVVALTVDTWAPIFANGLSRSNWWRSSRARRNCDPPRSLRQFAMLRLRRVNVFGCTYHGARLLYTVTYVPDNRRTDDED